MIRIDVKTVHRIGKIRHRSAVFVDFEIGGDELAHLQSHVLRDDILQLEALQLKTIRGHG
jgi:hypothetical protein